MVRAIAAGWYVGDPQKGSKCRVVERVRSEEILVVVVTRGSPEVTNLLGLDLLVANKWGALKRRSGDLQDR
jgi:hypothetical protein